MSLQWIRRALLPLLLLLAGGTASAQVTGRNFDHLTTGFELTGAHRLQACESCHVGRRVRRHPEGVRRVPCAGVAHRRDAQAVDSRGLHRQLRRVPHHLGLDARESIRSPGSPRRLRDLP